MKKILLASTVVISMAGFAKTSVYAEESQVTKKTQTTDVVDKKEETAPPKKVPQATPKKEVPQVEPKKESKILLKMPRPKRKKTRTLSRKVGKKSKETGVFMKITSLS